MVDCRLHFLGNDVERGLQNALFLVIVHVLLPYHYITHQHIPGTILVVLELNFESICMAGLLGGVSFFVRN